MSEDKPKKKYLEKRAMTKLSKLTKEKLKLKKHKKYPFIEKKVEKLKKLEVSK